MRLKIAIQKSGRLYEDSVLMLKECGIVIGSGINTLITEAANFPLDILFLRDDDIPQYVADGVADIGIVGQNVIQEKGKPVKEIDSLGFAKCRLSIAVPKGDSYTGIHCLQGKRIATSYPYILRNYLAEYKIEAEIHEISGSVEIAPGIGLADAICDLVSSGSTLFLNGLKEVEVIFSSEAALIAYQQLTAEKEHILQQLIFRINAVRKAKRYKYVLLNVPNAQIESVSKLMPGMKSPSVLPLATEGWSSMHSVLHEDEFWHIIEKMKSLGAEGILITPIEKMIL